MHQFRYGLPPYLAVTGRNENRLNPLLWSAPKHVMWVSAFYFVKLISDWDFDQYFWCQQMCNVDINAMFRGSGWHGEGYRISMNICSASPTYHLPKLLSLNKCSSLQGSYPFAFHLCNVDMNARVGTEKGNGYPWISAQLLLLSFLKTIILENARFLLVLSSLQKSFLDKCSNLQGSYISFHSIFELMCYIKDLNSIPPIKATDFCYSLEICQLSSQLR